MILKEKVGEDEYILDTTKLKDIEFPFYTPYNKSAYYVPSDKSVYLPIKFFFENEGRVEGMANICARLTLPEDGHIDVKLGIKYADIKDAMVRAATKDESLFEQPELSAPMEKLADTLNSIAQAHCIDLVMQAQEHELPVFLFQRGKLIAVAKKSVWDVDDEHLVLTMKSAAGPFLRAFQTEADSRVSVIVLTEDGEVQLASHGTVVNIKGTDIKIEKEKNSAPSRKTVNECVRIYEEYEDNFMNYFLDKEDEEGRDEFESESIFAEDE